MSVDQSRDPTTTASSAPNLAPAASMVGPQSGLKLWLTPAAIIAGAAGIVSFLNYEGSVLAGRFAGVEARMQAVEGRVQSIDTRIVGVDEKVDRRAEAIEKRVEAGTQRQDTIVSQQAEIKIQLAKLEEGLNYARSRLDRIADKLQVASVTPSSMSTDPAKILPYSGRIFQDKFKFDQPAVQLSDSMVGQVVSPGVKLRNFSDVPPKLNSYRYFSNGSSIVLVDPKSRRVIDVID